MLTDDALTGLHGGYSELGAGAGGAAQQGRVRPNRVTGTIMKFQLLLPDPSAAAAAACQTEYWPLSVS
jgi:hypothetical protein